MVQNEDLESMTSASPWVVDSSNFQRGRLFCVFVHKLLRFWADCTLEIVGHISFSTKLREFVAMFGRGLCSAKAIRRESMLLFSISGQLQYF